MFKKSLAVASVVAFTLMNINPAFAKDGEAVPSTSDRASIVVKNVEAGATVTAYQIAEPVYNSEGLLRYQQTEASKNIWEIEDIEAVKDRDVEMLSRWLYSGQTGIKAEDRVSLTYDASTKSYVTNNAEAGSYIVLVRTSDATYIYNPMVVSNDYKDANIASSLGRKTKTGAVDNTSTNGQVDVTADNTMVSSRQGLAYAKKSIVPLDKDIVNSSTGSTEVEDVQVGDTVTFDIFNTTPDYSEAFTDITYRITDTQMDGLTKPAASAIKVYTIAYDTQTQKDVRSELSSSNYTISVDENSNKFTVDFDGQWLKDNPVTRIVIRYSTVVNDNAKIKYLTTVNRAELEYSTLPTDETGHLEDTVQLYTFEGTWFKIAENGSVSVDNDKHYVVTAPLKGATFELRGVTSPIRNAAGEVTGTKDISDRVYTMTTGTDGKISFDGLDAGTYRLRETEAPEGMFLTDNIYTVVITPKYGEANTEGAELMDEYTIEIYRSNANGVKVAEANNTQVDVISKYVFNKTNLNTFLAPTAESRNPADYYDYFKDWTEENFENEVVKTNATTVNALGIVNQHLSKLPSTGGEGTFAFTIAGALLSMGGSITLFGKKRKTNK